jgi:hypothetical protein
MTLARAGGVLGVAGVALLLSTVPAAAGAGTWSSVPAPGSGLLVTVDARTDTDAWAVGSAGYLRWNGTTWNAVATAGLPAVRDPAVSASGANDAWVVGSVGTTSAYSRRTGTAIHWDGTAWTVQAPTLPLRSELRGVAALSATNVWAVGKIGIESLVEHWDGAAWTRVAVPSPNVGTSNGLVAVSARSASDIWAVGTYDAPGAGNQTFSLHYDGTAWSLVSMPASPQTPTFPHYVLNAVVALSANDVWAVGQITEGAPSGTLVEHWNGTAWSVVASPTPGWFPTLRSVAARSATDVWAVGEIATMDQTPQYRTFTLHWDGAAWTRVASPPANAYSELYAVAARPGLSHVWAVGNTDTAAPFILERH